MDTKLRQLAGGVPRVEARVRAVIEAACQQLQSATARAFRLLALSPGPEVTTELAATVLVADPHRPRSCSRSWSWPDS